MLHSLSSHERYALRRSMDTVFSLPSTSTTYVLAERAKISYGAVHCTMEKEVTSKRHFVSNKSLIATTLSRYEDCYLLTVEPPVGECS